MYHPFTLSSQNDYIVEPVESSHLSTRITAYHHRQPMQDVQPNPLLFSQLCMACGSGTCTLKTHKVYSDQLRATRAHQSLVLVPGTVQMLPAPNEITNPRIDPFARYPIPMTSEEHEILDDWARPWGIDTSHGPERHLFPHRHIDIFLPHAMRSPLLMRVALSLIVTHTSYARGKISEEAYVQQRKTLEYHLAANTDSIQLNSDANILAAMSIISNYSAHGNMGPAFQLMEGIYRMVAARGGLHQLGMSGQVAGYVGLADHVYAVMLCQKPTFEMSLPSLDFPGIVRRSGVGFEKLYEEQRLNKDIYDAAIDTCRAFDLFDDGFHYRVESQQLDAFFYLNAVAEYQLACINATSQARSLRENCICMALLIMNHIILRNLGGVAPVARALEVRYWAAFRAADELGVWEAEDGCLLMWLLITPLVIAVRGPCQYIDYAVEKLEAVRPKAGVNSLGDFEHKILRSFLCFSVSQSEMLLDIWKRIS